jgi:hypothetical protein
VCPYLVRTRMLLFHCHCRTALSSCAFIFSCRFLLPVQLTNVSELWVCVCWGRAEVLREFASKRHVKLSRVTVWAKDEGEHVKPAPKHRRRRASGSGEPTDSGGPRCRASPKVKGERGRAPPARPFGPRWVSSRAPSPCKVNCN